MGGIQQRKCEVWLTIQRNGKNSQKQMFDFSKQRTLVSSNNVVFPSFLHFYEQTKTVTFSLLKDYQNQLAILEYSQNDNRQLHFTKVKRNFKEKVWRLLRQEQQIELKEGYLIKLGRIELQVQELKFSNNKRSIKNLVMQLDAENNATFKSSSNQLYVNRNSQHLKNSDIFSRSALSRMKQSDILSHIPSDPHMKYSRHTERSCNQVICRFCFDGSSNKDNPLFNVCHCAGSVKHIHYQCLKNWIKNKMGKVETSHCIYYHYQPLICELCKHIISNQIIHEGRKYKLFETQKIYPPYMKLTHCQDSKIFQILIRLDEGSNIEVGRGSENELNLNDPSISRSHCSFYYTSHQLFLKGKKSKYGTFVELLHEIQVPQCQPIQLLIENNLISIDIKQQEKSFLNQQCCNISSGYKLVVK